MNHIFSHQIKKSSNNALFKRLRIPKKQYFSTSLRDKQNAPCVTPHFKISQDHHPLHPKAKEIDLKKATWINPSYNHIWSEEEVKDAMEKQPHHNPKGLSDNLMYIMVRSAYHTFNFITGYKKDNPKSSSLVWRLIVLESLAGCPGMVGASIRHLRSLRHLERDHGWIHTLLNEAENERMHLLCVMRQFDADWKIRSFVVTIQCTMVPFMTIMYLISPKSLHRFVGYLEETAVHTYTDIIRKMETPGTHLNKDWMPLPAPNIAKTYWQMPEDAMWYDVMKQICADEANHRDVNHTFSSMDADDPNPWVLEHHDNARVAWQYMDNSLRKESKSYLSKDWIEHNTISKSK